MALKNGSDASQSCVTDEHQHEAEARARVFYPVDLSANYVADSCRAWTYIGRNYLPDFGFVNTYGHS